MNPQRIYNIISLGCWLGVFALTSSVYVLHPEKLKAHDASEFSSAIWLLRFIQTFQIIDIILVLIGVTRGGLAGAFLQSLGRLIVTWGFMSTQLSPQIVALVLTAWSIADANRSLYYLVNNGLTKMMRYNGFLVLYPLGITGEMLLINNYIDRNRANHSQTEIMGLRVVQALIFVGFLYMFVYMLKNRSKALKKEAAKSATGNQKEEEATSSTRTTMIPKRD